MPPPALRGSSRRRGSSWKRLWGCR
uniref:ATSWI3A n=1 Tax=Arundo donax TaxID=35708 RepID=A0A0A9F8N6_ARUDO